MGRRGAQLVRWCSRSHAASQVPTHDNGRYVKLASQTASPRGVELDSCSIARRRSSVPAWRYASVVATDLCRKSWASRRTVPGEKHDLARAVGKPVESQNGGWLPVLRRAVTEVAGTGCTISGTPGVDSLTGFSGADRIFAGPGADVVRGNDGKDFLDVRDGVHGNDRALGGAGNDTCRRDSGDALSSW